MVISDPHFCALFTLKYANNNIKGIAILHMLYCNLCSLEKFFDLFCLLRCHLSNHLQLFLRLTGHDSCCGCCIQSLHVIRIRYNNRFYILDDTSAGSHDHLVRQFS